jgi:hypothetical protein
VRGIFLVDRRGEPPPPPNKEETKKLPIHLLVIRPPTSKMEMEAAGLVPLNPLGEFEYN